MAPANDISDLDNETSITTTPDEAPANNAADTGDTGDTGPGSPSPNGSADSNNPVVAVALALALAGAGNEANGSNATALHQVSPAQQSRAPGAERATVPSACVPCRSKHLKCDGLNPCTRCSASCVDCVYVRSRRGFKGPRKNMAMAMAAHHHQGPGASLDKSHQSCPMVYPNGHGPPASSIMASNVPSGLATPPDHRSMPPLPLPRSTNPPHLPLLDGSSQELVSFESKPLPLPPGTTTTTTTTTRTDVRERCIEAYFFHFYPAHPFTLPRASFQTLRGERPIDVLEAAMRYVGSFYVPQAPTMVLSLEAEAAVYHPECPEDGFKVQAMLLLAIGLDGATYQEKALSILLDAQDIAVDLGMNTHDFAFLNGAGSQVLAESWRRTWWELYLVDGMIAGVHQKSNFRMKDMTADTALPCEEREYELGQIPPPHTMREFDDDDFDGRDYIYSSFTYRIAAIRNLGRVLQSRMVILPDTPTIDRIDAYLVNWRLHLPDAKKKFIRADGTLDEMIFQAHMITEATTIVLHRELSELDSSVAKSVTSCAPHKAIIPGQSYNVHAAKTIQAAQDVSKLIQLPVPLVRHTHFFTCVVTLASIVHLSCWSVLMPLIRDEDLKQQLKLNTGALKTLWQVWPAAGKAFGQVKGVAQEIYRGKKQAAEIGFWSNLTEEEVLQSMIDDQSIMEDLQLLN